MFRWIIHFFFYCVCTRRDSADTVEQKKNSQEFNTQCGFCNWWIHLDKAQIDFWSGSCVYEILLVCWVSLKASSLYITETSSQLGVILSVCREEYRVLGETPCVPFRPIIWLYLTVRLLRQNSNNLNVSDGQHVLWLLLFPLSSFAGGTLISHMCADKSIQQASVDLDVRVL